MTLLRHFSLHGGTIGRETGSNWVKLGQFWQLSIVPGAGNCDGRGENFG
jgi:hypothetical protein